MDELGRGERLLEHVPRRALVCGWSPRDVDDPRVGPKDRDLRSEREAVHLRHQDVRDDDVDLLCSKKLERRGGRIRDDHLEVGAGEHTFRDRADSRVIVDDQDARSHEAEDGTPG